ncbi:MAG: alkyl sulfatase dimerization domain-containing protein [Acetobacteraceae bacterium]|jgi:alkyl sulfatase BDS1-like metallo-beta-lactamase superfamily hydrolase
MSDLSGTNSLAAASPSSPTPDFTDTADFADAARGFIATLADPVIRTASGTPVWDLTQYAFLDSEIAPPTVNPSLWRMARLNMHHGLFQVTELVFQVRGLDLANLTIVESATGIIVIDTLTTVEVAAAAMALYYAHRGHRPVRAVIYTHSHSDHFGGVQGVIAPDAVGIPVIAPDGFMEAVGGENVLPGNAMARRAQFQFGGLLRQGPLGQVDAGLGKITARGTQSLIAPTLLIRAPVETHTIDGVEIEFQLAPETEAPAEMHLFLPQWGVLNIAENATHHLHNFLPLRGAVVRDPRMWAKYLGEALDLFGARTEVLIAQHHWPVWGRSRVRTYLEKQHDLYKFIHDQSVRLLNLGRKPGEVAEEIALPAGLAREWYLRGYYGSLKHNAKAVYQRYLGWYDGNPALLDPLPPRETAERTIAYMGGVVEVVERARADFAAGAFRWVAQVMQLAVAAAPEDAAARALLADALEQLGFAAESATWRNAYLYAAQELREGKRALPPRPMLSPALVSGLTTELLLDYLAVRLNPERSDGVAQVVCWTVTDQDAAFGLALRNCVLSHWAGLPPDAVATLASSRRTLEALVLGVSSIAQAQAEGALAVEGDVAAVERLFAMFDTFPLMFDVIG